MRKFTLLMLLCGTMCLSAIAQNKIEFREFTLDNGLQVIMHQDKSVPIVATYVLYHVGAKNENPERTGFAHFSSTSYLKVLKISLEGNLWK